MVDAVLLSMPMLGAWANVEAGPPCSSAPGSRSSMPPAPPPSKLGVGDGRRSEHVEGPRVVEVASGRPEVVLNAVTELVEYAWEVAKDTVTTSAESFFDAVSSTAGHDHIGIKGSCCIPQCNILPLFLNICHFDFLYQF
jgi:hypothetical protein